MFLVRKKDKNEREEEKKREVKKGAPQPVIESMNGGSTLVRIPMTPDALQKEPRPQQLDVAHMSFTGCTSPYRETEEQNGSLTFHAFPVLKDLPKLSLPALAPVQVSQRTLTLQRGVAGDFGFNVRRTQFPDLRGRLRTVVFAEPAEVRSGPPRPNEIRTSLLPGDQLVKVNGRPVESLGREELLALIQNSGNKVELTVRAMPELAELCDRKERGVRDTGDSLMLPPVSNSYLAEGGAEDECYWLMHKNGYTMVRMVETQSDGKVRISVGGTEMEVDVTDVDKANPAIMDRVEDLARLRYINETSAVHVLRHRYGSSLLHTNAGSQNIICMASQCEPLMSNKLVALFRGCRRQQMPPHIYASAQHAYRTMQMTGRSQCMILTGVSGSGKSTQLRNLCHYLCEIAGWTKSLSYERISSALGVIEAFGNCATPLNKNGSRFTHMFTLSFDSSASLRSARMQTFLLDSTRLVKLTSSESNFHVFYYLLEGAEPELVQSLQLDSIGAPFHTPLTREEDKNAAYMVPIFFLIVQDERISSALGVIEAFGNCATPLNKNGSRFTHMFTLSFDSSASLRSARMQTFLLDSTRLVKLTSSESNFHVFYYLLEGAEPELVQSLQLDSIGAPFHTPLTREEDKNAAYMGWSRLKEALSALDINGTHARAIFSVLAAIGHLCCAQATQGPAQRAQFVRASSAQHAATLLGVRVDQLASAIFRGKMSTNAQSTSAVSMNRFLMSNRGQNGQEALDSFVSRLYNELFAAVVALLNRGLGASNLATSVSITIIDYPGGNFNAAWTEGEQRVSGLVDLTYNYFNERIAELFYEASFTEPMELYAREQVDVDIEKPAQCPDQNTRLIDQKQQLLNCVDIEMRSEERRGLLCILDEEALFPGATDDSFLERIFMHLEGSRMPNEPHAKQQELGRSAMSHAAVSDLFSPFVITHSESATLKMRKATQAVKLDAAGLRTASGFFSSISMQTEYLISFARRSGGLHFVHCMQPQPPSEGCDRSPASELLLDVPFVRSQLRSLLIVDAARASSRGYPERLPFTVFRRRFQCLVEQENSFRDVLDDRAAVGRILERAGVFPHTYRLGLSQVLLRSDVLADLENRREQCLNGMIVSLQRACREHLAAKWLARRRTLETAIRCIQRNGRCYMKVKEWLWWRLYTKVTPLLAAARSDEKYREWEKRMRDIEAINNELRMSKSRLEGRVAELEQLLAAECSNTQTLSDVLQRETEHRVQAQKQLILLQQRHADEPRLSLSSSSHSRLDHSLILSDTKTAELHKEVETLRESESTQRSRAQKTIEHLRDVEGQLLDIRARNELLEARNIGFDEEIRAVKEECASEKEAHEQARKQRDIAAMSLEQKNSELQIVKAENADLRTNIAKLRKELEESSASGSQTEEVVQLKKAKRQLETKCAEQEDELDDLAGRAQMLQQTVTRLEMAAERAKTEKSRDLDAKEDEIDELRAQYQRRLRAFEEQVADMQEANSSLVKQNRILEARMREIDTHSCNYEESSGHYKREMHKAMALLHDTQAMLAHERESAPSQALIRQLHEQLDDAEALKLSILKGKHSLESELSEMRAQLETALAAKKAAELRVMAMLKEKNSAITRADEHDDQLQAALKKYKEAVQQKALLSIQLKDQFEQLADVEKDKKKLSDKLHEVTSQLEFEQHNSVEKHRLLLAEQKIRDLEAKLSLELITKNRLDTLLAKAVDDVETLNERLAEANRARDSEMEAAKRAHKEVASLHDQLNEMRKREHELVHKCKMATKEAENMEMEKVKLDAELKSARNRIDALRESMQKSLECIEDEEWDEDEIQALENHSSHSGSRTGRRIFVTHRCDLGTFVTEYVAKQGIAGGFSTAFNAVKYSLVVKCSNGPLLPM
ncbi:Unconventional myosin-XVIIIa [Toxocara canis]|uniref:Unconventional myosin-XVIIIa n=1 Tax=Toxocara canis TaxID=6265 RepID=A0A0B2V122_TOXCA|nr:Unconventional myosin-XVIIIa [Toxocara canis]